MAIFPEHLGAGLVNAGSIEDASVTEAKLATGAVTADKIASGAVTSASLDTGAVVSTTIAAGAVETAAIAANAVGYDQLSSEFNVADLTGWFVGQTNCVNFNPILADDSTVEIGDGEHIGLFPIFLPAGTVVAGIGFVASDTASDQVEQAVILCSVSATTNDYIITNIGYGTASTATFSKDANAVIELAAVVTISTSGVYLIGIGFDPGTASAITVYGHSFAGLESMVSNYGTTTVDIADAASVSTASLVSTLDNSNYAIPFLYTTDSI